MINFPLPSQVFVGRGPELHQLTDMSLPLLTAYAAAASEASQQ
jgi:hypothetical protein